MDIGHIEGCTRVAGKSQGYRGLPIRDEVVNCPVNGPDTPRMVTAWLPTPAELAALNAGASVHVLILGRVPPPMLVEVGPVPGAPPAAGDDDQGGDPTKPDLLRPRGNSGVVSPDICHTALLLVGDTPVAFARVLTWTQDQCDRAYDWAVRVHLAASDNDDVYVPPRPDFIPRRAREARR